MVAAATRARFQPPIRNPKSEIRKSDRRLPPRQAREAKLTPSPPADRRTLIRRVYFDLIGLPPTPEEIEEFVAGADLRRRRRQLLASPHYGERWARHWLDVAHFGESDGFEFDKMRPHAWRYRDWVIEALNRDLPYDEFARLQIAGDVLRPADPVRSSPRASSSAGPSTA